jgi:hypothetical protein
MRDLILKIPVKIARESTERPKFRRNKLNYFYFIKYIELINIKELNIPPNLKPSHPFLYI